MASPAQAETAIPPAAQVLQMAFGYSVARCVYVAAKLGIADLLKDGPKTAEALAAATGSNPDALYRMLRALASVGVFTETQLRTIALNPLAEVLRTDIPNSIRNMVLFVGDDMHGEVYSKLEYCIRTGKNAMEHLYGMAPFQYIQAHPDEAKLFNDAMRSHSTTEQAAILEAYDFGQFRCVADIAGGEGHLLASILSRHPNVRGILFDMPEAIEHARAAGLVPANRAEFVGGDFFETVPSGADAYVLKHIIHDWDEPEAKRILANCRRAIPSNGKLLILEMPLPGLNEPGFAKILDIEMLVIPGGRERTLKEYESLLASAGFRLNNFIPTRSPLAILEALPVQ